jgi:hypothetical protein
MINLAPVPAFFGLLSGISLYPIAISSYIHWKRWKMRIEDENRLKNTTFILSGTLAEKKLRNNLKSLSKEGRQGVLHIFGGRRKGYILMRNGQIVDAFFRNTYGCEALTPLLNIEDGDYFFEPRAIYQPDLVRRTVDQLLLDR